MKRAILVFAVLAACGPVSVQQAERECFERARLAQQPRGEVAVGVNSDGDVGTAIKLKVSSDYLQGRDPAAIYDQCVMQKSGQPPSQSLYSRSDWKS